MSAATAGTLMPKATSAMLPKRILFMMTPQPEWILMDHHTGRCCEWLLPAGHSPEFIVQSEKSPGCRHPRLLAFEPLDRSFGPLDRRDLARVTSVPTSRSPGS